MFAQTPPGYYTPIYACVFQVACLFLSGFGTKSLLCIFHISHACYMPCLVWEFSGIYHHVVSLK
jgi:hypothetical protein